MLGPGPEAPQVGQTAFSAPESDCSTSFIPNSSVVPYRGALVSFCANLTIILVLSDAPPLTPYHAVQMDSLPLLRSS